MKFAKKNVELVKKGTVLAEDGERESGIFILMGGCLGIFKNDKLISKFYDKGTILGEVSLILNKPRSATIKAIQDSHVIKINGTLEQIIKNCPDVAKNIMINLAERLVDRTEDYYIVSEKLELLKKERRSTPKNEK